MDTANFARVNPLPSPATSSSSSSELHLYIDSDTSSPSVPIGQTSSSLELFLQGHQPSTQAPAAPTTQTPQPPFPKKHVPSLADEVEQSGHSTPETVVPDWAYSGRIRGSQPRLQPLVYPPPVLPTPHTQYQLVSSRRCGPTIPPIRPQQPFTQPSYNRPTFTDSYPCTDPSSRRRPRAKKHEINPSFFTYTGFKFTCAICCHDFFTRPTALLFSWKGKPLCADTRHST